MQLFLVGPTPKAKTVGSQNITINGAVSASGLIKIAATSHGLETGDIVQAFGITGTVEANGQWVITVIDANHFTLNNSTFANAYVSGGAAAHVGYATSGKLVDNTTFTNGAPNKPDVCHQAPFRTGERPLSPGRGRFGRLQFHYGYACICVRVRGRRNAVERRA